VGRFPCIDPLAERFAWVSPYNYAENEPVGHVDLWGLQKSEPKEETYYGGTLPTVQVEERVSSDVKRDYSIERYGYNGSWDQYKDDYGLDERWTYASYLNYWLEVYSAEYEAWVKAQDKAEAARETVERLTFWMGEAFPTVGAVAMGSWSPYLPFPRGFRFVPRYQGDFKNFLGTEQFPFQYSGSLLKHLNAYITKGEYAGMLERPYMRSPLLIRSIMRTGKGAPDKFIEGAIRYEVAGMFRGSKGTWELVIDPKENRIYHFLFNGKNVKP